MSLNASHPFPVLSSNSSTCITSITGSVIFLSYSTTNILLLLPLSALVLFVGFQKRRQQSTSMKTSTSHADVLTYHMVAMEIFGLMGSSAYCSGHYIRDLQLMKIGFHIFSIIFPGETLFHCMTCVECYLAVIHPITYLSLKKEGGTRIRNISIGSVWLMSFGWNIIVVYYPFFPTIPFFLLCVFSLFVSSFCSLSVLRALIRPSPGEGGGNRVRVDQSKLRAFYTIIAIMGTLVLRFAGLLVCIITYTFLMMVGRNACAVLYSVFWLCLPSSVVLPLLFLHRKLACCRYNTESG